MVLVSLTSRVEKSGRGGECEGAFVALITTSVVVAARGTGTLDESVRKEELVVLAVGLVGRLESEEAVLVKVLVDLLGDTACETHYARAARRSVLTRYALGWTFGPICRNQSQTI